jgi:hypothetical protein
MQIKLELEVWVDIQNYENYYQISNFGRVKALSRKLRYVKKDGNDFFRLSKEKILNPLNIQGYKRVVLCNNGNKKNFQVHRLVAIHFIDNPENKSHVNHMDCVKDNNNLTNLEWCTPSENTRHAMKNGLLENALKASLVKTSKIVLDLTNGIFYDSIHQCFQYNEDYLKHTYSNFRHTLNSYPKNKTKFIKL